MTVTYDTMVYENASLARSSHVVRPVQGTIQYDASITGSDLLVSNPSGSISGPHRRASWLPAATADLVRWLDEPEDWDRYGARCISTKDVSLAHHVLRAMADLNLPVPHIVGTPEGGVRCEWTTSEVSIEILVEHEVLSLFIWDKQQDSEWEGPLLPVPPEFGDAIWQLINRT